MNSGFLLGKFICLLLCSSKRFIYFSVQFASALHWNQHHDTGNKIS